MTKEEKQSIRELRKELNAWGINPDMTDEELWQHSQKALSEISKALNDTNLTMVETEQKFKKFGAL